MAQGSPSLGRSRPNLCVSVRAVRSRRDPQTSCKQSEDEEQPAVDMADAGHAVEFRYSIIRYWPYDFRVCQSGSNSEWLD